MKKILITFGDRAKYQKSIDLIVDSAYKIGKVDKVLVYDDVWLKKTEFWKKNLWILGNPRGFGFWAWKPFIIQDSLMNMEDNDVVIYSDAGLQIIDDLAPLYDLAKEKERLIFKLPAHGVPSHKAFQWTKGDCFSIMKCNESKYWLADMTNGAISVWKKTSSNWEYIKEWINYATIPQCITDMISIEPNRFGFKDHRHDQSILSNLRVKYSWELFRDPTQYGNIEKKDFKNSAYDQLFWHHRNFKHPKP